MQVRFFNGNDASNQERLMIGLMADHLSEAERHEAVRIATEEDTIAYGEAYKAYTDAAEHAAAAAEQTAAVTDQERAAQQTADQERDAGDENRSSSSSSSGGHGGRDHQARRQH